MSLFDDVGYLTPEHYEYAEKQGITRTALTQRYYYCGFTLEEALTTPYKKEASTRVDEMAATRPVKKRKNTA